MHGEFLGRFPDYTICICKFQTDECFIFIYIYGYDYCYHLHLLFM